MVVIVKVLKKNNSCLNLFFFVNDYVFKYINDRYKIYLNDRGVIMLLLLKILVINQSLKTYLKNGYTIIPKNI